MSYEELVAAGRAARAAAGRFRGRTAGQHYPSDDEVICVNCLCEFTRPSRMGPRPRTCSRQCAWALSKREARQGADRDVFHRRYCYRDSCQHCGGVISPFARVDARYCSGRCRVAAHRARNTSVRE